MTKTDPIVGIPMAMEPWEYRAAGLYVTERDIAALDRADMYGATPGGVDGRVGMLGEMAFARYLGVYFDPTIGIVTAPDVAPGCQVRSTHIYRTGQLVIHARDNWNHNFVLARVKLKPKPVTVYLVGWCSGAGGRLHPTKSPEGVRIIEGDVWVDSNFLHSMETLDVASIRRVYERLRGCAPRTDTRSLGPAGNGAERNPMRAQKV